jgi:flavin reductase (DIM6/NTAB) family NADH-FMN oxidoreductase RutF
MEPVTSQSIDDTELRRVFGCFPSGVIAVCAMVDGEPVGMAGSSFTTDPGTPPLVFHGSRFHRLAAVATAKEQT